MDYREKFKELRIDRDYTQQYIAEICGVSDATVGHWENKKREMTVRNVIKLCEFYGVSSDYIFGLPKGLKSLDR